MEIKSMNKEELELLSYTDLTAMILKENKKPMNTPTVFRMICDLLEYSDTEYTNKIGEFYTSLTTDKRFVLLGSAEWDLKDNHAIPVVMDDDEEEIEDDIDDDDDIEEDEEEPDEEINIDEEIEDDDDIEDLNIIEDEEIEEEN